MTFTIHKSLQEIAHQYDGFILDQYGVMHNGQSALPGAVDCVKQLSALGKKLCILSNTSSPSQTALAKLPRLGFDPSLFVTAVTSGEEASRFIREAYCRESGEDTGEQTSESITAVAAGPSSSTTATKAIFITWDDDVSSHDFLQACEVIEPTMNYDEAKLVVLHGVQVLRSNNSSNSSNSGGGTQDQSLGTFMDDGDCTLVDPILKKCREYNLPMICANPDFIVQVGDGSTKHMPGKIAQRYQEMGGDCRQFGKPHEEHFRACLRELDLDATRVVHVGDSLHHDIAGANTAGIDNVFITNGIHGDYFATACMAANNKNRDNKDGGVGLGVPTKDQLDALFEMEGGIVPTYAMPLFRF